MSEIALMTSLLLTLPGDMPLTNPGLVSVQAEPPLLWVDRSHQQARAITVRVLSTSPLGSGTVVKRQGSVYTVVTNQHVLRGGQPLYRVQMSDGQIYFADVVVGVDLSGYDLALLQFRSEDVVYAIARLGSSASLQVGDEVFAVGFPAGQIPPTDGVEKGGLENNQQATPYTLHPTPYTLNLQGFAFRPGRITLVLDRPLEDGYQIGSNNHVKKGMSGGPLLNRRGEVVAINGMHAYPLWDATEFYADGSVPCALLQDFIARSSWGIPIEVLSEKLPGTVGRSFPLLLADLEFPAIDEHQHRYTPYFILQMQLAAAAAKSCVEWLPPE